MLLALALVAAACGGDGGTTTEPAPTAAATSTAVPTPAASPSATMVATPAPTAPTATPEPTAPATPEPTPSPTAAATPDQVVTPEPTPASTPSPPLKYGDGPHPSGLDMAAIETAAAAWMQQVRTPGLVLAVAHGDEDPWAFSWGTDDVVTGEPLSTEDYFRIGSITKPVTTTAVMSLVDEGVLDLDTPVTAYLGDDWYGDYEHGPDITLRHLMGHTAGFVEYAFDPGFFVLASARLSVPITPEEIVRFTTNYGPVADFGTEYNYSTAGHVIAGMVIEAVTGNLAHEELRARIFEPLGVRNTYLTPGEFPPQPVVVGYNQGMLAMAYETLTTVPDEARASFMGRDYISSVGFPQEFVQSAGWTGGGLEGQIGDLPRLFRGLFAGGLMGADSLAEMTTAGVNPDYGLGVGIGEADGHAVLSHGGGVPGFRSIAMYLPELDLSVAASTNLLPPDPDIGELVRELIPIIIESWDLTSS